MFLNHLKCCNTLVGKVSIFHIDAFYSSTKDFYQILREELPSAEGLKDLRSILKPPSSGLILNYTELLVTALQSPAIG